MSEERRRRLSYLLRLWQAEQEGASVWRASLESAHTGERWGFASVAELYAFLEQETTALNERRPRSSQYDDVGIKSSVHPEADR
jgi:hypothetical protein